MVRIGPRTTVYIWFSLLRAGRHQQDPLPTVGISLVHLTSVRTYWAVRAGAVPDEMYAMPPYISSDAVSRK